MGMEVGFIGLGLMGKEMAKNIITKGFRLTVIPHRNRAPIEELHAMGARVVEKLEEMTQKTNIIIMALPGPAQVKEIVFENNGLLQCVKPGTVLIEMSTSTPGLTRKIAKSFEEKGAEVLDAPMCRGTRAAKEGNLLIMVGGKKEIMMKCMPVLKAMGSDIKYIGETGSGHKMKLLNNIKTLTEVVSIAEVLALGVKLGLNGNSIFDVLSLSSANSYMFQLQVPKMLQRAFEPGAPISIGSKDLMLGLDIAREVKVPMSLANQAYRIFLEAEAFGLNRKDISAIFQLLENKLGLNLLRD